MTDQLEILDLLAAAGKEVFETSEVKKLTGLSPQATSNLLTRLVGRGLLDRVARGHYVLRPFGALGTSAAAEDIALAVGAAFRGRRHRIAYRSALDFHGLLEHPSRELIVAVERKASLRQVSGRPLRIVVEAPRRITVGAVNAGHRSRVSSLERALLECAARPELAGGASVVASALAAANPDPGELIRLAQLLGTRAGLQRLGSLAKALDLDPLAAALEPLSYRLAQIPLDPELAGDHIDGAWRDETWRVEWPFSIAELEETVRR